MPVRQEHMPRPKSGRAGEYLSRKIMIYKIIQGKEKDSGIVVFFILTNYLFYCQKDHATAIKGKQNE